MDPTIQFDKPAAEAVENVSQALGARAFRVMRSFDFKEAAAAHPHCVCPYHETENCTCQYLMLIAHSDQVDRGTLLIAVHSHQDKTFVSLVEGDESEWLGAMLSLAGGTATSKV